MTQVRDHAARIVRSLPPAARWRVRNLVALGRWMGSAGLGDRDEYPDAFWAGGDEGDWAGLAALVRRYCAPRSIVDVGCGDGRLLAAMRAQAPGIDVLGIDGSAAALARARVRGVPIERHDLAGWRPGALRPLERRTAGFDVAACLEAAEHLPPWSGAGLVRILTQGRLVLFSAAHPGQGGTLHMNERPFTYWRGRFEARGFRVSGVDDAFRAAVRRLDLPWWYAANIHVLERAPR